MGSQIKLVVIVCCKTWLSSFDRTLLENVIYTLGLLEGSITYWLLEKQLKGLLSSSVLLFAMVSSLV